MANHHIEIKHPNTSVVSKGVELEVKSNSKSPVTIPPNKIDIKYLAAGRSVSGDYISGISIEIE
jgi:hypothetical protein